MWRPPAGVTTRERVCHAAARKLVSLLESWTAANRPHTHSRACTRAATAARVRARERVCFGKAAIIRPRAPPTRRHTWATTIRLEEPSLGAPAGAAKNQKKSTGTGDGSAGTASLAAGCVGQAGVSKQVCQLFFGQTIGENVKLLISVTKVYDHCYPRRDSWTGEIFSPCLRRDSWIGEIFSPCLLGRRDYFPEINIYF